MLAAEDPLRSSTALWFGLGIVEDETWVIPQFGGLATEQTLDRLAAVAASRAELRWAPSSRAADIQER